MAKAAKALTSADIVRARGLISGPGIDDWLAVLERWLLASDKRDKALFTFSEIEKLLSDVPKNPALATHADKPLREAIALLASCRNSITAAISLEKDAAEVHKKIPPQADLRKAAKEKSATKRLKTNDRDLLLRVFPESEERFTELARRKERAFGQINDIYAEFCKSENIDPSLGSVKALSARYGELETAVATYKTQAFIQAERFEYAPVSVTPSFKAWLESAEKENTRLGTQVELLEKRVQEQRSKEGIYEVIVLLGELLACFDNNEGASASAESKATLEEHRREIKRISKLLNGDPVRPILEEWLGKLEIAQASMPTFPEDWTKPAADLLSIYIVAVASFVLIGSLLLAQPLWTIVSTTDAANLAFHPGYIAAVGWLVWRAVGAVRKLPMQFAEQCKKALESAFKNEIYRPADRNLMISDFQRQLRKAKYHACLIAFLAVGVVGWGYTVAFGNHTGELLSSTKLSCNNQRYAAFGKGVVIWNGLLAGTTYPATDGMAVICPKSEEKKASEVGTKSKPAMAVAFFSSTPAEQGVRNDDALVGAIGGVEDAIKNLKIGSIPKDVHLDVRSLKGCPFDGTKGCPLGAALERIGDIAQYLDNSGLIAAKLKNIELSSSAVAENTKAANKIVGAIETNIEELRQRSIFKRMEEDFSGHKPSVPPNAASQKN